MVAVSVTRLTGQVIRSAVDKAGATRESVEVAATGGHTSAQAVQATRVAGEVIRQTTPKCSVTRSASEVAATGEHTSSEAVQATRLTGSVLFSLNPCVATTRISAEALASSSHASAQPVQTTRLTGQAIGRVSALPVVPLPLVFPNGTDFFVHNWTRDVRMRTIFNTDVTSSPRTAAEERVSQTPRPYRVIKLRYTRKDLNDIDRLLVTLRRMTRHRLPVPIVQDETPLLASIGSLDTTISFDVTFGRFFPGARIAIVELDLSHQPTGKVFYRLISNIIDATTVEIDSDLGEAVTLKPFGGWAVFPMMDCDTVRRPRWRLRTDRLYQADMTLQEVYGPSALSPWGVDDVQGFPTHGGYPIFNIEPDWIRAPRPGLNMPGRDFRKGLGRLAFNIGDRERSETDYILRAERAEAKSILQFMESRLGRTRPFWEIDQETVWQVVGFSPTGDFIDFSPQGTFSDLEVANFQNVGLIYEDGTAYVRDVISIQDLGTIWRMTVSPQLPMLSTTGLLRLARAHLVRQQKDTFEEEWTNALVMEARYRTIEVLNEGDAAF